MGIGLYEYRAAIGAFAGIAARRGLRWRSKTKEQKSDKPRRVGGEERCEKGRSPNSSRLKKRGVSLDRWKTRDNNVGQRSKTLDQREHLERSCKQVAYRPRSQSNARKRTKIPYATVDTFKNSCITCKTELFNEKWQRGRTRQRIPDQCKGTYRDRHCSDNGEGQTGGIRPAQLHFLTSAAALECFLLEQAIFSVVQMLLIRSGIETNPGPTTPTSSPCCNASQHFNRVKNTIAETQKSFRSKVTKDTLTRKVVEIEETGTYLLLVIFLCSDYFSFSSRCLKNIVMLPFQEE